MKLTGWIAWYRGGKVYRSTEIDWVALPTNGMLLVMVYFDELTPAGKPYREVLQGANRYFMAQGTSDFFIKSSLRTREWIMKTYDVKSPYNVKVGLYDDDETMNRVQAEAMDTWL